MFALRRACTLMVALVLALTSQGLALARGQGAGADYVVICVGGGLAMVPVGPDGQPVGPAHVCPDGVLAVADLAPAPAAQAPVLRLSAVVAAVPRPETPPDRPHPVPAARGPPAFA